MTTPVLAGGVPVLAHQGGWDEALLVVVPLLVLASLLVLAKRRARRWRERTSGRADPHAQG
ncbi:MAG: hypothetical protein ACKO91_12105 [Acidimicrobiales bacterium]